MEKRDRWSTFICRRCEKRMYERKPNVIGCAFVCFDGEGTCFPDRPKFLKGGKADGKEK